MADPRPLVIAHHPCLDGFTAAWAAWLKHPDAEFVHGVHGQQPPDCSGRDVFLLDFSYKADTMYQVAYECASLTVLDHHKTAVGELRALSGGYHDDTVDPAKLRIVFDMEKSGARLAWEWFRPDEAVPLLVRLVEDRDLWRWAVPNSKALNACLFSMDFDFCAWNGLRAELETPAGYDRRLAEGEAILRRHMKDVRELVAKLARPTQFKRAWSLHPAFVPCANLPYTMSSDAAGLMAEAAPFAATYYRDSGGDYVFSLRSRGADGADVGAIAQLYGGGGHRNAAGFRVADLGAL